MSNKRFWTDEDLKNAVKESLSLGQTIKKLGLRLAGGNYKSISKHIARNNLDISHFSEKLAKAGPWNQETISNEKIFCENSSIPRTSLKRRLLKLNLIEYKCRCGLTNQWNGKSLTLQIEHKNGIFNDNRIENLEWLCPNCHSQTETFAGRSLRDPKNWSEGKRIVKIDKRKLLKGPQLFRRKADHDEVFKKYLELNQYRATGEFFGISDVAVRKIVLKRFSPLNLKKKSE